MPNIKDFTTEELITELAARPGIKKIAAGLYKDYSLKKKYSKDRGEIASDCVLVIDYYSAPDKSNIDAVFAKNVR